MSGQNLRWPGNKRIAVLFNLCLEQWSEGKAPGISPMGNPLPAGVLDMTAISWAAYGCKRGIYRLLEGLGRYNAKATVLANGAVAERFPEALKAVADAGHEVAAHSYAMDVVPALLSEEDEKKNIDRCTNLLEQASRKKIVGWISPRATSTIRTPSMLVRAGYRWYGDTLEDDLPYVLTFENRPIVAIPLQTDVNDMPFMKHGSVPSTTLDAFDENLRLAEGSSRPEVIDVTIHCHIFGHRRGASYFARIVEHATRSSNVWIGTRAEMAEHVLAHHAQGRKAEPTKLTA
jgi:peptidoglycan/xylan/chitin deacetylase (PgdA/CDA1 family)